MSESPLSQLPVELLPLVFKNIARVQDLAACSSVSKTFRTYSVPVLYQWAYIFPWRKNGKEKVKRLLETLDSCPSLAKYVQILELREFPRYPPGSLAQTKMEDLAAKAVSQCINLRTCIWTRDGSLGSTIIQALQKHCPLLREMEINGHHLEASLLTRFNKLEHLSLIMPDRELIQDHLEEWVKENSGSLRYLALITKATPFVTDDIIKSISHHIPFLEHLHLVGNPKVTHSSCLNLLHQTPQLQSLSLEGVSPSFDMNVFASQVVSNQLLRNLTSISINHPSTGEPRIFFDSLITLLTFSPLTSFQIWTPGGYSEKTVLPVDFAASLVAHHGHRLRKVAVQRLETTLEVVEIFCKGCPNLEQLFIVQSDLRPENVVRLASHLSHLPVLATLHISYTSPVNSPILAIPTHEEITKQLVGSCSNTLTLIGLQTRVLEIHREWQREQGGNPETIKWESTPHITLRPYSGPRIPEAFLVMRA